MGKIISVLVRIHFFSEQPLTEFSSELKKIFPTFNKQLPIGISFDIMLEDFDFLLGQWKVFNTRLTKWLCECSEWVSFESHHTEQKRNSGVGNFAIHEYKVDNTLHERSIIRQYDDNYHFWKIDRMDNMSALAMPSLKGTFWNNKGSFLSKGIFDGQDVLVWVEWTKICKNYAYWEQALSKDEGKTWELNWMMEFYREKGK